MDWFSGGVAAAITSCRQENAIFIVYVYGECTCITYNVPKIIISPLPSLTHKLFLPRF